MAPADLRWQAESGGARPRGTFGFWPTSMSEWLWRRWTSQGAKRSSVLSRLSSYWIVGGTKGKGTVTSNEPHGRVITITAALVGAGRRLLSRTLVPPAGNHADGKRHDMRFRGEY